MSLKSRIDRLFRIVDPIGDTVILVFAVIPLEKVSGEQLPADYIDLPFEPFMPQELSEPLSKAATLGELEKACKKAGYGLDILPVARINEDLWGKDEAD